jgi:hypothetical protein
VGDLRTSISRIKQQISEGKPITVAHPYGDDISVSLLDDRLSNLDSWTSSVQRAWKESRPASKHKEPTVRQLGAIFRGELQEIERELPIERNAFIQNEEERVENLRAGAKKKIALGIGGLALVAGANLAVITGLAMLGSAVGFASVVGTIAFVGAMSPLPLIALNRGFYTDHVVLDSLQSIGQGQLDSEATPGTTNPKITRLESDRQRFGYLAEEAEAWSQVPIPIRKVSRW